MSESDSSALRVYLLVVYSQLVDAVTRLTCEGFVYFEDVDITDFCVGFLEQGWDGHCWTDAHEGGFAAFDCVVDESAQNWEIVLFSI